MSRIRYVLGASLALAAPLSQSHITVADEPETGVLAYFEGDVIDLSEGWGEATACTSDGATTLCFRTEAEMDEETGEFPGAEGLLACTSSLRLYRSTSYGGGVLQLTSQFTYINLSLYSFDNDTSSYKVGACDSYFYDGANGGTPLYPGTTTASSSATSMASGWDNRVSSVYIA